MGRILRWALSDARFKLQQSVNEFFSQVTSIASTTNSEEESTKPHKAFYLLSLILLASLFLLSPDKIPQIITPMQPDMEIFQKAQELTRIIRKLIPGLG